MRSCGQYKEFPASNPIQPVTLMSILSITTLMTQFAKFTCGKQDTPKKANAKSLYFQPNCTKVFPGQEHPLYNHPGKYKKKRE
jgi:hypothetical protein